MVATMTIIRTTTTATTPLMIATMLSELDDGAAIDGPTGTAGQTQCYYVLYCINSLSTVSPDIPAAVDVLTVTSYSAPGCRPETMT